MLATLSQTLTWSHFIELITIEDDAKRLFYQQMGIAEHWSKEQPEGNYTHKVLCIRGADIPSINNCRHGFIPSGTTKKSSRDWALFFVYPIYIQTSLSSVNPQHP
ncbi:MAG: hypothetical protein IJ270_01720 [Paludibacteraceae bacterium]|nr:hypothetical protein [Paludibacteraceae bacterium]